MKLVRPTAVAAVLFSGMALAAQAQDAASGEKLFKQRCGTCHSVVPGKESPTGPNLLGVVGRAAGSTDFKYSDAMKQSGVTWDAASLDQFIAGPSKLIKGTRMTVSVPNAQQRGDIVSYLATLKN
ncbi:cytochrome c [Rhizobium leguminosarum]|uniref:Cytochrome c n=1 Tax=Rhizobium leguminosarum TaxID=384 RepID=A0AAE2MLK0_RHILE|nr:MULTISPECIES: c-type cytochrome [Rhizobium]MBB4291501.1 cytochrome c [Rhizobium leguminosarum]MBB4296198.1 cytochrome c [Rhizobium leguminosarum]MBB4308543.1 cytochrome c [Rhizobium leguminosarum]MBB4416378.1 cytochrome c [Rhizobium leguminosarum]MBB4430655.1 cytochrome c [Rhizobium esperanzae]